MSLSGSVFPAFSRCTFSNKECAWHNVHSYNNSSGNKSRSLFSFRNKAILTSNSFSLTVSVVDFFHLWSSHYLNLCSNALLPSRQSSLFTQEKKSIFLNFYQVSYFGHRWIMANTVPASVFVNYRELNILEKINNGSHILKASTFRR